jgi:hypothetical protein
MKLVPGIHIVVAGRHALGAFPPSWMRRLAHEKQKATASRRLVVQGTLPINNCIHVNGRLPSIAWQVERWDPGRDVWPAYGILHFYAFVAPPRSFGSGQDRCWQAEFMTFLLDDASPPTIRILNHRNKAFGNWMDLWFDRPGWFSLSTLVLCSPASNPSHSFCLKGKRG